MESLTNHPIKFQNFSDSVVIYLPLRTDKYKLPIRGIYGILCATATTFLCSLAAKHPIRGGIDVGVAMEISKKEIYGAALARAYSLESNQAQYPRIVLGPELIDYLHYTASQNPENVQSAISKRISERCLDLITIDDDGLPILDYLGETLKISIANKFDRDVVLKAYHNVLKYSSTYQKEQNSKLAFRYSNLRNYFDARLEVWFEDPNELSSQLDKLDEKV
ncbi:MAG: hypothetical protein WAP34_03760 [Desulfomonilia bacterium]|jgi:hypothetical protein